MNRCVPLVLCLFVWLGISTLQAAEQTLLPANAIDAIALLPPPVPLDSQEAKSELELIVALQQSRTDADLTRIRSEDRMTLANFTDAVGPWFTPDQLPKLAALIQTVHNESRTFVFPAKSHFAHPRPPAVDPRVKPVVAENNASYPSGHATRGMLDALILSVLLPDHREALIHRGQQIGWDRVVAGVHFPSDVVAGRTLGQAVAQALLVNPQFQQRLAEVRQEVHDAQIHANALTH